MIRFLARMTALLFLVQLTLALIAIISAPYLNSPKLAAFSDVSALYLFDVSRGRMLPIADGYRPTWSPDGNRLVYAAYRDNNQDLYLLDLDTMIEQRLTDDPMTDDAPVWSPDGSRIAYLSYRRGFGDIYLIDLETGENRVLLPLDHNQEVPVWSRDGRYLAFTVQKGIATDMAIYDMTGGEMRYLTALPQGYAAHPAWSRTENTLAFVTSYNSITELHLYDIDAQTDQIRLQTAGYWAYQTLSWSPDGTQIGLHCIHPNGSGSLCTLDVASGTFTDLVAPVVNIWSVKWSPDERWLAYTVGEGITARTWLLDMYNRIPQQVAPHLTDSGGFAWQ